MSKIKLTVVGLEPDEAGAIIGLLPKSCKFTMSNENDKPRRTKEKTRKHGVTVHLLKHIVGSNPQTIEVERLKKLAKNYGARNPSAASHGLIRSGYVTEIKGGRELKITAEGKKKAGEE